MINCMRHTESSNHPLTMHLLFRWLHGQATLYAQCMFYHRHEYDLILFLDTDEFITLKDTSNSLVALLAEAVSANPETASISFFRYVYASGCRPQDLRNSSYLAQFYAREHLTESSRHVTARGWTHLSDLGDKLAVRPLLVDEFYFHFLVSARPPFDKRSYALPPSQAFIKHLRGHPGADACQLLTYEDPV